MDAQPEQQRAEAAGAEADADTDAGADSAADPSDPADAADPSDRAGAAGAGDGVGSDVRSRPRRLRDPLLVAALCGLVVAALGATWFGVSWWRAAHDDALRFSQTRDEVLQAGEQAVQNLNTLDYRTADQGLRLWEQSTTGTLHDQLTQGGADFLTRVRQAKTVTAARILDGAVVDLNDRTGRASVIVALEVTVTDAKGRPTAKRERLQGELVRTGSGWKLSAVGQVPVAATG